MTIRLHDIVAAIVLVASAARAAGVEVRGAGSTFAAPLFEQWTADYQRRTGTEVIYDAVGSGIGLEMVVRGDVDFGATDVALDERELARLGLAAIPIAVGGVVPVVHVDGVGPGRLKLTGPVLADIFLGRIRRWNEAPIANLNPELRLPDARITVVHRSDASGTSSLLTRYLSSVSAQWQSTVGISLSPAWPLGSGSVGNDGVASYVQRTRFSIGYVEYAYARSHRLADARLRNFDGHEVRAGADAFRAAMLATNWDQGMAMEQIRADPPGPASWPITGATYVVLPTSTVRAGATQSAYRFLEWIFLEGEAVARVLGFEPLPAAMVEPLLRQVRPPASSTGTERTQ